MALAKAEDLHKLWGFDWGVLGGYMGILLETFDKGFKKRSIRHVIGYLKILHSAKKQLLEEKWKEGDLI